MKRRRSSGANWATHQNLLRSMSPIVDCGVHYVDVMCRMTGARLSAEIGEHQVGS